MKREKRLPRPRARQPGQIRLAKRRWPPECMELPGTVAQIERGVSEETQRARDAHGAEMLLPVGGALIVVPASGSRDP